MKRMAERRDEAGRTIMRGAQATALGFLVRLGARLAFLFVAGRLYGAGLFGVYVIAAALVELAVSVGSLGTKKTLFPLLDRAAAEGARRPAHVVLDAALMVALASVALAALTIAGALSPVARAMAPQAAAALIVLAPMIAGQALLDLFLAAARWTGKVRYEVVGRSLVEPYFLAAGAIAAFYLGLTGTGLLVGYWCGTLAALVYAAWGARHCLGGFGLAGYRPSRAMWRAIAAAAGANSAVDLLAALYMRIDLYLVGLLLGEGPTGIYGMARQVTTPIRQVRQSFDGLLIPAVARTIGQGGAGAAGAALASATRLILAIQLPILLLLSALGARLMAWVGPGFAAGYWPLVILAGAELLQSALGIGDLLFVYLRPRIGLYLTMFSMALGIGLAGLLIPRYGLVGAALAQFAAFALRTLLRSFVLRMRFAVAVPHTHLAGPLAAAGLAAAVAFVVPGDLAAAAAGLAVYGAALLVWLRITDQRLSLSGFAAEGGAGAA